jgi:hypothetical protein
MATFARRIIGAAFLDSWVYEEVEADVSSTGQAVALVLLTGVAGGVGLLGVGDAGGAASVVVDAVAAVIGWMAWAMLTYLIGTRLLPEPQTEADVGQLLRTLAFAASPGLLRVFGVIPVLGLPIYALASAWMFVATFVAVRQALDYRSTGRAIVVCGVGLVLSVVLAVILGIAFETTVS